MAGELEFSGPWFGKYFSERSLYFLMGMRLWRREAGARPSSLCASAVPSKKGLVKGVLLKSKLALGNGISVPDHIRMFGKVLVANRGEIAVRVIRALREAGIRSVAVYSDADRASLAVQMADEAAHIGPATASESYLAIDKIIDAAPPARRRSDSSRLRISE